MINNLFFYCISAMSFPEAAAVPTDTRHAVAHTNTAKESMSTNPIYSKFFANASFVSSKTFDEPDAALFRKQLAMWEWLSESKPSSEPTADLVERLGNCATHHVFWLTDEGSALRNSVSYRGGRRVPLRTQRTELCVRNYLNNVHRSLVRLRTVFK